MNNENNLPTQLGDDTTQLFKHKNVEMLSETDFQSIGSGDTYLLPNFLTKKEANDAFEKISTEITFQQWYHMPSYKEDRALKPLSRIKCALAKVFDDGKVPHYRFPVNDQNRYPVVSIDEKTPTLLTLLEKVIKETGIEYNHVVVLYYRDGNDAIGPHKDKTLDLDENAPIVSISLGAERPYVLCQGDIFKPTRVQQFNLPNGGLLSLGAKTNTEWYHSVIMLPDVQVEPRISITFRKTDTFIDTISGKIVGKGADHNSKNWPMQLKGNHRVQDNYLDAPLECARVLEFWFGNDAETYDGALWWRGMMKTAQGKEEGQRREYTDAFVRENWLNLVDNGMPKRWLETVTGVIGSIIVYDQLSRHVHRGTKQAFKNDESACELANKLLDEHPKLFSDASFSLHNKTTLIWTFQIFVYFALIHSEKKENCERGTCGIANLHAILQNSAHPQAISAANRLSYLFKSAKQHLQVLLKFNRYPHRNEAMGRESTADEVEFLKLNANVGWTKSQLPPVKSIVFSRQQQQVCKDKKSGFRLLVLHSNRQDVMRFRQKTYSAFSKMIGPGGLLVYACAPHKYTAKGEALDNIKHLRASESENTRCWWNASDDPNTMIYDGIEQTIKYIDDVFETYGPFDGIIGFSQGGAAAGLIASLVSQKSPLVANITKCLQFCIIISGFYIRDVRPEFKTLTGPLAKQEIDLPSFHVWGDNDALVTPERSRALFNSFAGKSNGVLSSNYIHDRDHYKNAIEVWPIDEIHDWLHRNFKPQCAEQAQSIALSGIRAEISQHINGQIIDKVVGALKPLDVSSNDIVANDVLISVLTRSQTKPTANALLKSSEMMQKIIAEYAPRVELKFWSTLFAATIDTMPASIAMFYLLAKSTHLFHHDIFMTLWYAIRGCHENNRGDPIICFLPNYKNGSLRKNGIIDALIEKFPTFHVHYDGKNIDKIETWKAICNSVQHFFPKEEDPTGEKKREAKMRKGMRNPDQLEALLSEPFSEDILNPRAEPVEVAQQDEFKHLHDFLRDNSSFLSDEAKVFSRATLTTDNRLDLCKRELGPAGVPDLEISLEADGATANPKVRHLLLGNNVAGEMLGKAVGRMIKKKSTAITTWYIAGNDLNAETIAPVVEALEKDNQVDQLWLKRNPLKPAGAIAMQKMLSLNSHIVVLDLTNTGLLDQGTSTIFEAIASNKGSRIQYLYLESNGITTKSVADICRLLPQTRIKELCLSGNRVGDRGAKMVAPLLDQLEHLKLSSCGIGADGASALALVLSSNKCCKKLDLGFLKSTNVLKEVPNAIANDGAVALANALKTNKTLLSLVLLHNGIFQYGVAALAKVLADDNKTLLHLNIEQLGIPHNEVTREAIRIALSRNLLLLDEKTRKDAQDFINNAHLSGIKSVYRNEIN